MKKYLLILLLILSLTSCSTINSEDSIVHVNPEIPFELKVGQTAEVEGHYFSFQEVSSDSRCPVDAKCIWAGKATVVLVSVDNNVESNVTISTNSDEAYVPLFPQTKYDYPGIQPEYRIAYLISLNSLSQETNSSDYAANFTIWLAM